MHTASSIDASATATIQRERRVGSRFVRELFGVSEMTIWRWMNSDVGFPKPIYISGRRYWREADLLAWLDAHEAADADARANSTHD